MKNQLGQASLEWLMIALMVMTLLWIAESQFNIIEQLRSWGASVIQHYHFIFNYIGLAPGSGL